MSNIKIGLRLIGNLPSEEIILSAVKTPFRLTRRGYKNALGDIMDKDILTIRLARWSDENDITTDNQAQLIIERIAHMETWLVSLDRSQIKTEFYIGTVRTIDQGGFELPAALVMAIASAGLSLAVSILVVLDDEPE